MLWIDLTRQIKLINRAIQVCDAASNKWSVAKLNVTAMLKLHQYLGCELWSENIYDIRGYQGFRCCWWQETTSLELGSFLLTKHGQSSWTPLSDLEQHGLGVLPESESTLTPQCSVPVQAVLSCHCRNLQPCWLALHEKNWNICLPPPPPLSGREGGEDMTELTIIAKFRGLWKLFLLTGFSWVSSIFFERWVFCKLFSIFFEHTKKHN
jgi:hypothetical protein